MLWVNKPTLMEAWQAINWAMLGEQYSSNSFTREVGKGKWVTARMVTLTGDRGFGLDESEDFQFYRRGRMTRLDQRYVDPALWNEDLGRMFELRKQLGKINRVQSLSFNFHRRALKNKPVPLGGGCLVGFTLTFNRKELMFVDALSRATEITRFFYSDMLFLQMKIREALEHCEMADRYPANEWYVRWNISSAHQNDIAPSLFVLSELGTEGAMQEFFLKKPYGKTRTGKATCWADEVRECFWNVLMTDKPKTFFTKSAHKRISKLLNIAEWNRVYEKKWGKPIGR